MARPFSVLRLLFPLVLGSFVACETATPPPPVAPTQPPAPKPVASGAAPEDAGASVQASAPIPEVFAAIQRDAAQSSAAYEIVRSLTDESGPRLTGSPGDKLGVAWALRALPTHGLTNVHAEKVIAPRWERGVERAEIVSPVHQPLHVTAVGGSVATPVAGIEAELLEVETLDALKALPKDAAKGKIVFLNLPMQRTRDGFGYGSAVGMRHFGAHFSQKAGAIGVVLRSIGTDHERLPHTGMKGKSEVEIPIGALSVPDAELLHRTLAAQPKTRVRLVLGPKKLPDVETANVVGEVKGRERPDEIVILGAHLDSWDLGTGALDDGAGVGIVVAAAELVAKQKVLPRRTIRVVLYANEESGGAGGRAYAKAHEADVAKHVVGMEADFGTGRVFETHYLGDPAKAPRFGELALLLAPLGVAPTSKDAHGGSDLGPLLELGMPVVDLQQDGSRYFDIHHTANDTFDKVDKEAITQAAAAFATMAYALADMEGDFGRAPSDKRERKR